MNSFYVTLPCGVKSVYHDNVLSDYITHLPRSVQLDGKWEVALVEFHFTKSWFNVDKDMWIGALDVFGNYENADNKLYPGKYSIDQMLNKINSVFSYFKRFKGEFKDVPGEKLESLRNDYFNGSIVVSQPALFLDDARKRVMLIPGICHDRSLIFPHMDPDLLEMLGLTNRLLPTRLYSILDGEEVVDSEVEILMKQGHKSIKAGLYAERAYDIERGIHAIYVYSDVVEENFIGDVSAQCLRVCTLPSKEFGETVNLHFDQPHYIQVSNRSFHTIRITLKDQVNEKIKFQFGETLVKLHFRKVLFLMTETAVNVNVAMGSRVSKE